MQLSGTRLTFLSSKPNAFCVPVVTSLDIGGRLKIVYKVATDHLWDNNDAHKQRLLTLLA